MSVADRRINSNSCVLSSSGRTVHTQAAAPATSGEAKLVPFPSVLYPVGSFANGSATGMCTPGAARSTVGDNDENAATWLRSFVAPTVRTCG